MWPKTLTQYLVNPLPNNGNLKLRENYQNISLDCHPSKVMVRIIIINRLKSNVEEMLKSMLDSELGGAE
ncbi:hypothetical protein DPMN_157942 [Dreissena polymorpha]|uniref:Uncharacterized protein n=1 Tax=Dreissena polymorpha TaxID=45954 RepID=A0A9D4EGZ3_DREPO|nr:hypothetical protein DPMN_157942 [Dreissena polymorpha]